ncbi:MAG: hypothetical protein V1685_05445 [Parcubacteria group bacterium]
MEEENLQSMGFDPMTGNQIDTGPAAPQSGTEDQPRLQKAAELMSPADFEYYKQATDTTREGAGKLFDLRGKALHTTNSFYLEQIVSRGTIRTEGGKDGLYGTAGASFTDGNFEKATTFQTLMDDQNTRSTDKRFNTQRYSNKAADFVQCLWDQDAAAMKEYLQHISGKKINSFEEAVAVAETFKYQATPSEIKDKPEELAKLFGATIVFDKEKLPELTTKGTEGLQQQFELRSYRPDGVPLSKASAIFVPEIQIKAVKLKLQEYGLTHIDVRPSEELEIIRMNSILHNQ